MKNHYIRHGDVSFHPVEKATGEIIKHNGSFVVEYGEVTGHKHLLKVKNPEDLEIRKDESGNYFFVLKSEATISHEEHKTLVIPAGTYQKKIEREMEWFGEATVRQVVD